MNAPGPGPGAGEPPPPAGWVWLGDLVRALNVIGEADPATEQRVARLLGLGPGRTDPPAQDALRPRPPGASGRTGSGPGSASGGPGAGAGPEKDRDPAAALAVLPGGRETEDTGPGPWTGPAPVPPPASGPGPGPGPGPASGTGSGQPPAPPTLSPLGQTAFVPPSGLAAVAVPLPRPDTARMRTRPPHVPLLAPLSAAALLGAALASWAPEGDVEADLAVDVLAEGLPLTALPRRTLRTLRHGVQVLVDHGPALQPFSRDQTHVRDQVTELMGGEHTRVLGFAYAPLRGAGDGPQWTWEEYRPPPRGTAVLVLSDCGTIGPPGDARRSTLAEWRAFADLVRRHGGRPLALVPTADRRVPRALTRIMTVIGWDRGTTVGHATARARAGRSHWGAVTPYGARR